MLSSPFLQGRPQFDIPYSRLLSLFAFARWIGTLGIWGWSGAEVKIDGVEYLIMKESDIMRVLVEVEAKKKAA